jgi:acetyltransferase-like isoleucine patch superfamily enzyme
MNTLQKIKIRILQHLAQYLPGGKTVRVWLHRRRGVIIGDGTFIGCEAIIETAYPTLVSIGRNCSLGIRSIIIAHNDSWGSIPKNPTVIIEDEVFVGPGCIILPGVTIGKGSVIAAGSVLTHSVPEGMMMQGNPARPVARCGVSLGTRSSYWEFIRNLKPM